MKKNLLLALIAVIASFNSCKKDEPDTETTSATDNSICEGEFSRLFMHANGIAVGDSGVQVMKGIDIPIPLNLCPDYKTDSVDIANGFPITMWLEYGHDNDGDSIYESSCTGNDGKERRGIIKAVFDKPWHLVGSKVTMYLQNYFVKDTKDEIEYEGTITVTRGVNSFTQTISNGECWTSSWNILWNSTRTITTVLNDSTSIFDDVVYIKGSADGTDRNGKKFSVSIDDSNPLVRKMGCTYIVKGTQTLKLEGKKDRTIDYGDGTCDNKATLTIGGNTFEFSLQ